MENFVISVIIISAVVIFVIFNSFTICGICDDITDLIDSGNTKEAVSLWESKRGYISVFVRDVEIDHVDGYSDYFGKNQDTNDAESEAKRIDLKNAVDEIKNSELPNFTNIF